LPSDAAW